MKNLLDFETFRLNEWNKMVITKNKQGTVDSIKTYPDEPISSDISNILVDVLSDDYNLIEKITGGDLDNKQFRKDIIYHLDDIKILSDKNIMFDETNLNYQSFEEVDSEIINELFNIKIPGIGKGEVLLSSYFKNVYKTSKNTKRGDCYFYSEKDNNKKSIEVKSAGSSFRTLSHWLDNNHIRTEFKKYNIQLIEQQSNSEEFILQQCIGGLACYIWNEKRLLKNDLSLVIFDEQLQHRVGNGETNGFIQIYTEHDENLKSIYDKLSDLIDTNIGAPISKTERGPKFIITINEQKKIQIHVRTDFPNK